jgi:hypothetical protein
VGAVDMSAYTVMLLLTNIKKLVLQVLNVLRTEVFFIILMKFCETNGTQILVRSQSAVFAFLRREASL